MLSTGRMPTAALPTSRRRRAWHLAAFEQSGVGYEFLDRYVGAIRAVTAADLQRVAQRYLAVVRTVVVTPTPP